MSFEKFLPCPGASAGARAFCNGHSIHMESDVTDLMEEDVWGDEASTDDVEALASSFDDSKCTGTHARRELNFNTKRTSRSLSQSQDSSVSIYSNGGVPLDYGSDVMKKRFVSDKAPRSAPVEVPVWSDLYGTFEMGHNCMDVDVDDDEERLPPHELLARQNAWSQRSMFSVVEGVGRTLKGRDARKVRDAVWKQTGFPG